MKPFQVAKPASDEFEAAIRWYEQRRRGLGGEFYDSVVAAFELIGAHPEMGTMRPERLPTRQLAPVVLIGPPHLGTFPVRWLLDPSLDFAIASEARRQLDFYLVDHPRDFASTGDPWQYAIYHCGTAASVYSSIHWSYLPLGNAVRRESGHEPSSES